jgi:hypothetical protein
MKSLLLIFTLLFSTLMFSAPSFAKWEQVTETVNGNTFYIDFERTKKQGGYVYFWVLGDYLKPEEGVLSYKNYRQGNCKLFRHKILSWSFHKEPMGGGTGQSITTNPVLTYPSPNSVGEIVLKAVCSR